MYSYIMNEQVKLKFHDNLRTIHKYLHQKQPLNCVGDMPHCIRVMTQILDYPMDRQHTYFKQVHDLMRLMLDRVEATLKECIDQRLQLAVAQLRARVLPEKMSSVSSKIQVSGTCWAHSVVRNAVRLLQIIRLIPEGAEEYFYYRYFKLITAGISCDQGNYSFDGYYRMYLLLKHNDQRTLFTAPTHQCANSQECTYNNMHYNELVRIYGEFTEQFKADYCYKLAEYMRNNCIFVVVDSVDLDARYPTKTVKHWLTHCMQPSISVRLHDEDNKCTNGHTVNLRYWLIKDNQIHIGIKDSNVGNLQVGSLRELTCDEHSVNIWSFMFDTNKIPVASTQIATILSPINIRSESDSELLSRETYYAQGGFLCADHISVEEPSVEDARYVGTVLGQYNGFGVKTQKSSRYEGHWFAGMKYGRGVEDTGTHIVDAVWNYGRPVRGYITDRTATATATTTAFETEDDGWPYGYLLDAQGRRTTDKPVPIGTHIDLI